MPRDEHDWSWWEDWKSGRQAARDVERHGRQGWGQRTDDLDTGTPGHQPDPYTGETRGDRRRRERAEKREQRQQARRTHADPGVNDWIDQLNPTHLAAIIQAAQDVEAQAWIDAAHGSAAEIRSGERPFQAYPGDDRWR